MTGPSTLIAHLGFTLGNIEGLKKTKLTVIECLVATADRKKYTQSEEWGQRVSEVSVSSNNPWTNLLKYFTFSRIYYNLYFFNQLPLLFFVPNGGFIIIVSNALVHLSCRVICSTSH